MTGGIKPVMIRQIPQPDWFVVEYMTTQGNFRKCLLDNKGAITGATEMKNEILSVVLLLISFLLDSFITVEPSPMTIWLIIASLISGVLGIIAGLIAWSNW